MAAAIVRVRKIHERPHRSVVSIIKDPKFSVVVSMFIRARRVTY